MNNNLGFSLVELMVVVAIIGIIAGIGIPQYNKFLAKTRQTEAKQALAAFFVLEHSFFKEWEQYTSDLANLGFGVQGMSLRYAVGFDYNNPGSVPCQAYSTASGAPTENVTASDIAWSCSPGVNRSNQQFNLGSSWGWAANSCSAQPALPANTSTVCDSTIGLQRFRAAAVGDPNTDIIANSPDGWTVDNFKNIVNSDSGIR